MATAAPQRDYYAVLGVPRDADEKAIKAAFRALALKYHPDHSKEPDAEARFKEIAEAYAVLSDPRKRADYDARGFAGVAGMSPDDLFAGIDLGDLFGGFGFGGGGLFERLFRPHGGRGPVRGRDVEVLLSVPLSRILTGGDEPVEIPRRGPCPACGGSGARKGTQPHRCEACNGTGQRIAASQQGNLVVRQITTCEQCAGRGTFVDDPCPECAGAGEVVRPDSVRVHIPPGIEDGTALRIPGHGLPSQETSGGPGDAYVVVTTAPDERFTRDGADLWHGAEIDVADAVLGTSRHVPTIDGELAVTIPPGTQPGTTLRLAGQGLPRYNGHGRGDLYVNIVVRLPEHLTALERQLWEQLRSMHDTGEV